MGRGRDVERGERKHMKGCKVPYPKNAKREKDYKKRWECNENR